jgi:hypothetical protein
MNNGTPFDFNVELGGVEVLAPDPPAPSKPQRAKPPKGEKDLSEVLEASIRAVLKDKSTKPSDRLKAIEAGAKLLMIRHKISGAGDDGNFFTKQ